MTRSSNPRDTSNPPARESQAQISSSGERVAVSSIPISHEAKTLRRSIVLDVPAAWLDTLLITSNTLPIESGEAGVVDAIVETLAALLPEWGVGACHVDATHGIGVTGQKVYKCVPAGEEHRSVGVDPARLFPGYVHERVYDVEGNGAGTTLHIASDDPATTDERTATNMLVLRAAQVLQRGLHQARKYAAAERSATDLRKLNSHMVQAEKLASLGQIAAGVVHELNNPLTSIVAYTDYLSRRAQARGDADDLERLRRVNESAGRMLRFTRDLVTYARPSSEVPVPVQVQTVIDQALAFCEHVLDGAGAQVERRYATGLPAVQGMPEQLAQVFVNLVTNACHAMPQGSGRLVVTTRAEDGSVLVLVEDNGHGIPNENLQAIFAPFFTTKTDGRGTGLGLSIVKNILEGHGGEIHAECVVPAGTRFVLKIPTLAR
jgi:two-component system, NtrC family, sensor kinase